jgi:hypothetical protein
MNSIHKMILGIFLLSTAETSMAINLKTHISLKSPGNNAVTYPLTANGNRLVSQDNNIPVEITKSISENGNDKIIKITFTALDKVYFNFGCEVETGFPTDNCDFYLPGFWYHKNLRSPDKAPSFHTSKSWNIREDRLSSPLAGVFNSENGQSVTVLRMPGDDCTDALTPANDGEVIISGKTSIGYLGFDNETGTSSLTFGYPYIETPKRYTRKLTLTPAIYTFAKLDKNQSKTVSWRIREGHANNFGAFVSHTWEYCFDTYNPQPLPVRYTKEQVKSQLTNFFRKSFVDKHDLKFNSGISLLTDKCEPADEMEIGFCGRVLLNAFNEIEYGESHGEKDLENMGRKIFQSFYDHGFTSHGYIYDHIWYNRQKSYEDKHSIRQQSEAVYAILHFLEYEKIRGRKHPEWEKKVRVLLNNFVKQQNADGSFARKFNDCDSIIDVSGGSTPSATVPLVMAYKYFGDSHYLNAAKRSIDYLEDNIISKSDYFSSTLDANCEDKEAAISAVTATYYMALISRGKQKDYYTDLCRQATYFALSWYYLWDVPFAQGQLLGDLNFKTRGWGNVSVENNHVDVFVFEFPTILKWLGQNIGEKRFMTMYDVISTSLDQLLPVKGNLCGIAIPGYYPEVIQHTNWDYGHNGKGFYNNYFAPGWTVASLWELYTPERTSNFMNKKYTK